MSVAQGLDQKATRVVGTSTIPNSFAELAERLMHVFMDDLSAA
jgi:hypothetical protein